MSLRSLINLRISLSVLLVIILGGGLALWQARQSVEREVEASFNLAVELIQSGWNESQQFDSNAHWKSIFTALQHSRHISVVIIDSFGDQTDLIQNPDEELESDPPNWFVRAVGSQQLKSEFRIKNEDGIVDRIIVSSDPYDEISEAWEESNSYFWSMVVMMLVIFLAINVVFHSVFRSVNRILTGLSEVESGRYNNPLPMFNLREFDSIANEINSLATILSDTKLKNQALARHTLHIQEQERQNMSRELHDEMGQSLTAIKAMSVALKEPTTNVVPIADNIIDICNHLAIVVRSMMRSLHPLSLAELGLGPTLKELTKEWQRRHPIMSIKLNFDEEVNELNDEITIHLYRIVQECLTNVVRHAQATHVDVNVLKISDQVMDYIQVSVSDNGIGGDFEGSGFGIRSMQERVENMQGTFSFTSKVGAGVLVTATIPLSN